MTVFEDVLAATLSTLTVLVSGAVLADVYVAREWVSIDVAIDDRFGARCNINESFCGVRYGWGIGPEGPAASAVVFVETGATSSVLLLDLAVDLAATPALAVDAEAAAAVMTEPPAVAAGLSLPLVSEETAVLAPPAGPVPPPASVSQRIAWSSQPPVNCSMIISLN